MSASRSETSALFTRHLRMRSLIYSALDGHQGTVLLDSPVSPTVAILTTGQFITLGGDAQHPVVECELQLTDPTWVVPENEMWEKRVEEILSGQVRWRNRTRFEAAALQSDRIAPLAETVPEGFHVESLSRATASRFARADGSWGAFPDVTTFLKRGMGFCALRDGSPIGYAMSYATYSEGIELDLWVHEDHRQRGLATCLGARLVAHCLERELEPHWDADNSESAGLALKLGYSPAEDYRMLRKLYRNEEPPT